MPIANPPVSQPHTMLEDDLGDVAFNLATQLGKYPQVAPAGVSVVRASNTAAVAIAATETLILAMPIIPGTAPVSGFPQGGTLQVGSTVRARIQGTYTSAGAQTATFTFRAGTAGTTADTSIATVAVTTAVSGTAILFDAYLQFQIKTLGAAGSINVGDLTLVNAGTTGIFTAVTNIVALTAGSAINTTTATFLDVSLTAGTGNSASITSALFEVIP